MRWIRLDVSFSDSPWLFVLSAGAQLAWVKLLCHVKRDGVRGRCKAMAPIIAARHWGVGEEDVSKMLQAASDDGAVVIADGEWEVPNWTEYQEPDPTAAERMRRMREKQSVTGCYGVTDRNTVTNGVTCRATPTPTLTPVKKERLSKESPKKESRPGSLDDVVSEFLEGGSSRQEAERFWAFYESKGWKVGKNPMVKWRAAVAGWISRNGSATPQLTREERRRLTS